MLAITPADQEASKATIQVIHGSISNLKNLLKLFFLFEENL
jgi:hypothetical protein